jgi:hypothetical protein
MKMTAWEVYWILKLDGIRLILAIAGVLTLVLAVFGMFHNNEMNEKIKKHNNHADNPTTSEPEYHRKQAQEFNDDKISDKTIIRFAVIGALCWIVTWVLPSTNQMIAIRVVPTVTNSEIVREIPDAAKELFKEYLNEEFKKN